MRVAFSVYINDSLGGAERRLIRIYDVLCKENDIDCVLIIRGTDFENAYNVLKKADCNIDHITEVKCFRKTKDCYIYLFQNRFDAIHYFEGNRFNSIVEVIAKIKNIKTIYTLCSYYEALNLASHQKMRHVRWQLKMATIVDLLNPRGKKYVDTIRKSKFVSITPGTFTDLATFRPVEKEKLLIFAAARLDKGKNPELLVEACYICKDILRNKGYKILVLGKGELEQTLNNRITSYEIGDIIKLVGYKQTSEYLPQANVVFSLQINENYPSQVIAEASACGCYLIITDVGDSRLCAETSFCKFIKEDKNELAIAIKEYMELDDDTMNTIIENARKYAERHYSIDNSVRYFSELIEKI